MFYRDRFYCRQQGTCKRFGSNATTGKLLGAAGLAIESIAMFQELCESNCLSDWIEALNELYSIFKGAIPSLEDHALRLKQ